jgi:hypothetical protein
LALALDSIEVMTIVPSTQEAVFGPVFDEATLDALELCYHENGFVILRGIFGADLMDRMQIECVAAQEQVLNGELGGRHGSTVFLDEAAKAQKFVNYVEFINEISPAVMQATLHPDLVAAVKRFIGEDAWLRGDRQFGTVYQDARPGKESGYTRIGWHSDWQASPSLDIWPSTRSRSTSTAPARRTGSFGCCRAVTGGPPRRHIATSTTSRCRLLQSPRGDIPTRPRPLRCRYGSRPSQVRCPSTPNAAT